MDVGHAYVSAEPGGKRQRGAASKKFVPGIREDHKIIGISWSKGAFLDE
jgi:hypothetical protein